MNFDIKTLNWSKLRVLSTAGGENHPPYPANCLIVTRVAIPLRNAVNYRHPQVERRNTASFSIECSQHNSLAFIILLARTGLRERVSMA
jgi:hypothetical protein